MVNIKKYFKRFEWYHLAMVVAIIGVLWWAGLLQGFFGAIVVANPELESSLCRIHGEYWNPDTVKCECHAGFEHQWSEELRAWGCVPIKGYEATSGPATGAPGAQATTPGATETPVVVAPPPQESIFSAKNVMVGVLIIMGIILVALVLKKK
jgi:hypothetical protein